MNKAVSVMKTSYAASKLDINESVVTREYWGNIELKIHENVKKF